LKRKNDGRRLRKEGVGTKGYEGGIERERKGSTLEVKGVSVRDLRGYGI